MITGRLADALLVTGSACRRTTGVVYSPALRGLTSFACRYAIEFLFCRGWSMRIFLKRLGIGLGVLSGILLLLAGLGLIAEPIALVATIVAVGSAVVLILWGKIWLWVIAFQESVVQGLLVVFVPYYWIAYLVTRKGRALQAMSLVLSAAVPALLTMAMLALFAARYENVARSVYGGSRRTRHISQSRIRAIEDRIRQAYETSNDQDVLQTVSFQSFSQVRGPVDPAKAERALAAQPGYVPGSFRFDVQQRKVMFQYRGGKEMARMYAMLLPAKADVMVALTPTFVEETDLPKTNVTANNPAAAKTPTVVRAPMTVSEADESESGALRTVSFQTLSQGQLDTTRAESVLAEMPGYAAGSFRFDQEQQRVTLQYRGQKAAATQYAFALQGKMLVMLRLKPVFEEQSMADD